MKRDEWTFDYQASALAQASAAKLEFHEERLDFWRKKREEVWATIRREGLEVDEKISMGFRSPKGSDFDRGAKVMVRNDLQADLDEVLDKLKHHTNLRAQYAGWHQALVANPEASFKLDIDDWQFFYGQGDPARPRG
jgi:hypothetical protein